MHRRFTADRAADARLGPRRAAQAVPIPGALTTRCGLLAACGLEGPTKARSNRHPSAVTSRPLCPSISPTRRLGTAGLATRVNLREAGKGYGDTDRPGPDHGPDHRLRARESLIPRQAACDPTADISSEMLANHRHLIEVRYWQALLDEEDNPVGQPRPPSPVR